MLNLTHVEIGLIAVEVSILVVLLALMLWMKRSSRGSPGKETGWMTGRRKETGELGELGNLLQESQAVSTSLSKNLEEKKELTQRLMKRLDEKIQTLEYRLNPGEHPAKEVYARVLEMSNAGAALADISRILKLPKGEIQLISDLQKYCQ